MKKEIGLLAVVLGMGFSGLAQAEMWKKVLSCDNGAIVIDDAYGKDLQGNPVRRSLQQVVIHDENIINHFKNNRLADPTPGVHGGYYDGVPMTGLEEYPGVMIFEGFRFLEAKTVGGGLELPVEGNRMPGLKFRGYRSDDSFLLRITYVEPESCSDGFCYPPKEVEVANWYFRGCHGN